MPGVRVDGVRRRLKSDGPQMRASATVWGCRGSVATPELGTGRYGGNTSCLEVSLPNGYRLIFDAGTGIHPLGNHLVDRSPMQAALFLTHFHWDHLQGLPFFKPLYVPGNEFQIFGPVDNDAALVQTIEGQMGGAFFPISTDAFVSKVQFRAIREETREVFGVRVSGLYVLHPGRTLAYRVDVGDRSIVFCPDNELLPESADPELADEALRMVRFAQGASLFIHDCQYFNNQYPSRRGWGHSSTRPLARVAAAAQVERVLLFHHDPDHTDDLVTALNEEFQRELQSLGAEIRSEPAHERVTYLL